MNNIHTYITAAGLLFLVAASGFSQNIPMVMEGLFDDWEDIPVAVSDPAKDALRQDFSELKVTNDQDFLYLSLRFHTGDHLLQDWNDIHLYIDTDTNTETGVPIHGIGADLEWCFGCREGMLHSEDQNQLFYQSDISLRIFPTVTSDAFELAIAYRRPIFAQQNQVHPDTIRMVLVETRDGGDYLPDQAGGVSYVIDTSRTMSADPIPLEREHPEDLRIVTYNTLRSGLQDPVRQPGFQRILQALRPDIMAFQELFDDNIDLQGIIQEWFPGQTWYVSKQAHSVAVISRFPLREYAILTESERSLAVLLELSTPWTGSLLVINSHLACCGNNLSRQQDADRIMAAVRDWKHGAGPFPLPQHTPIVHVGDFNLVGYARQLTTLTTGDISNEEVFGPDAFPDWDGTPFTDLFSRHTARRMGYTWRDDRSTFNPGKLDYVLFSDSVIEPGRHFILNTTAMHDSTLQQYGLRRGDSHLASDHYPRVFDISGMDTGIQSGSNVRFNNNAVLLSGYPNPFSQSTRLHYKLEQASEVYLAVYDISGRHIKTLVRGPGPAGVQSIRWNGTDTQNRPVGSGVYIYRLRIGNTWYAQKGVIIR